MKLFKIRRISRLLAALCLITTLMLSFDCTWTEASQTPDEDAKSYETLVPGTFDMLPPSRTLKYKTYLGVFLCPEKVRSIQP